MIFAKKGFIGGTDAYTKLEVITNTTTVSSTYANSITIQKDLDNDGELDSEVSFEFRLSEASVLTLTEETRSFNSNPTWGLFSWPIFAESTSKEFNEIRKTQYNMTDVSISFLFRDFDGNEAYSTRHYKDVFPNEISQGYNANNNLRTATNDMGDSDPSNDILTSSPSLERLLVFSHPRDNIPAEFEVQTVIENGQINTENLLASTKTTIIHDSNGEAGGSTVLTAEYIEVIPKEGVFYDNNYGYNAPLLTEIGNVELSYLYFDGDNNGIHETVFIAGSDGEIRAAGFDYDHDSYFIPNKRIKTNKIIFKPYGYEAFDHFGAASIKSQDYVAWENAKQQLGLETHEDGLHLEPTFSDSLFELWKTTYTQGSSQLIAEATAQTKNKFIQSVSSGKLVEDIAWQVEAQLVAGFAAAVGAGLGGPIMGQLGYFLTYGALNIHHAIQQEQQMNNYIAAHTLENEEYLGDVQVGGSSLSGGWFDNVMTTRIWGWKAPVTLTVQKKSNKHTYQGEIELSSLNPNSINEVNYARYRQQARALENNVLAQTEELFDARLDTIMPYMVRGQPSFMFMDSQGDVPVPEFYIDQPIVVSEEELNSKQDQSDVVLVMFDSDASEYQVYDVEEDLRYPKGDLQSIEVVYAEKFDTNTDEFDQVVSSECPYELGFQHHEIASSIILDENDYSFDQETGKLTIHNMQLIAGLTPTITNSFQKNHEVQTVLKVNFEMYELEDSITELSQEEIAQRKAMQALHEGILNYYFQYTSAVQEQERLDQIAHTIIVTVISTAISIVASYGIGKLVKYANSLSSATTSASSSSSGAFAGIESISVNPTSWSGLVKNRFFSGFSRYYMQGASINSAKFAWSLIDETAQELFVDPWVEAAATGFAQDMGANRFGQIVLSTLAESGRETLLGPIQSQLFSKQQGLSFEEYTGDVAYSLTGPELTQAYNKYEDYAKSQREDGQTLKDWGTTIMGTVGLFAGAMIGMGSFGFLSSATTAAISGAVMYCKIEELSFKDLFGKIKGHIPMTASTSQSSSSEETDWYGLGHSIDANIISDSWRARNSELLKKAAKVGAIASAAVALTGALFTLNQLGVNPLITSSISLGLGTIGMSYFANIRDNSRNKVNNIQEKFKNIIRDEIDQATTQAISIASQGIYDPYEGMSKSLRKSIEYYKGFHKSDGLKSIYSLEELEHVLSAYMTGQELAPYLTASEIFDMQDSLIQLGVFYVNSRLGILEITPDLFSDIIEQVIEIGYSRSSIIKRIMSSPKIINTNTRFDRVALETIQLLKTKIVANPGESRSVLSDGEVAISIITEFIELLQSKTNSELVKESLQHLYIKGTLVDGKTNVLDFLLYQINKEDQTGPYKTFLLEHIMIALAETFDLGWTGLGVDIVNLNFAPRHLTAFNNWKKAKDFNTLKNDPLFCNFLANLFKRFQVYLHAFKVSDYTEMKHPTAIKGLVGEKELFYGMKKFFEMFEASLLAPNNLVDVKSNFDTTIDRIYKIVKIIGSLRQQYESVIKQNRLTDSPTFFFEFADSVKALYYESKFSQTFTTGIDNAISSLFKYTLVITNKIANEYPGKAIIIENQGFVTIEKDSTPETMNNLEPALRFVEYLGRFYKPRGENRIKTHAEDIQKLSYDKILRKTFVSEIMDFNKYPWAETALKDYFQSGFDTRLLINSIISHSDFVESLYFGSININNLKALGRWESVRNSIVNSITRLISTREIDSLIYIDNNGHLHSEYDSMEMIRFPRFIQSPSGDMESLFMTLKQGCRIDSQGIIQIRDVQLSIKNQLSDSDLEFLDSLNGEIFVLTSKATGNPVFWHKSSKDASIPSGYYFGFPRIQGSMSTLVYDQIAVSGGRVTQNLLDIDYATGEFALTGGNDIFNIKLRNGLDPNKRDRWGNLISLEMQLYNLYYSDPDNFVKPAMFENLLDQKVYIHKDFILDNDMGFVTNFAFWGLKATADNGFPAVVYKPNSFTDLTINKDGNTYHLIDIAKMNAMIGRGATYFFKVDGKGTVYLLPDGNLITTANDGKDVFVINGLNFYYTSIDTRLGLVSSSTSNNIFGNSLSFSNLFVYEDAPESNLIGRRKPYYAPITLYFRTNNWQMEWRLSYSERTGIRGDVRNDIVSIRNALTNMDVEISRSDLNEMSRHAFSKSVHYLSRKIIEIETRKAQVKDLTCFSDVFTYSGSTEDVIKYSYTDENIKTLNNEIGIDELNPHMSAIYQQVSRLPGGSPYDMLTKFERLFVIAGAFNDIIFDPTNLQNTINELNSKIGPFVLKMLLIDKVAFNSEGKWRITTIANTKDSFRFLLGQSYLSHDYEKAALLAKYLCDEFIWIDGRQYDLENTFSLYYTEFVEFLSSLDVQAQSEKFAAYTQKLIDFLFSRLEQIADNIPDLTIREKHNLGIYYKEQFSILPSTSKSSTHLEKIYEKLWDLIYDIQTRKIEGNLQLYSWTDSFGTHSIVLTPQEVNSLLYTYSLPALHGKNYYDMRRITTGSTRTKLRFEELSAMKHFNTFKDRMFSTFQYFYDSGILAPAQSLYFQVHSSKLVENPYYNGISGYQTLKVSDGLSSLGNELSIAKLYVSILAGYSIKLSTSTDFENDLITEFSRAGCKIIEGETVFEALFRLKINKDLHRFFADTSVVRTLMLNSVHLRIPYTTVNTFFDVLFSETSLARQSSTIYQYIDFKKLDYLITTKADNIRKLTWKYFKANVGVTAATKNLKITTAYQLELFIKSIFYDPNNINNLVTFKANYGYDLSIQNMNTWKIIEDFNSVLYFNKYLV